MTFRFELLGTDGAARRGRLHTSHGGVETPVFMAVGTQATSPMAFASNGPGPDDGMLAVISSGMSSAVGIL